ncbi:MAG: hypothetical protein AB8B72_00475 [Crocinitomicaceae bacterium]
MVERSLVFLAFLILNCGVQAQSNSDWKVKVGANYAQGFITENTQTMQLHANFGFEKDNFEVRADGFYFLGQQGDRERFSINHQLFVGGYYYFLQNKMRPYVGTQIGLAYAQSTEYGLLNGENNLSFEAAYSPVFSFGAGLDYKLNDWIDLSFECRQLYGRHIANSYPTFLDEFRISIGVGFYLINKTTN